MGRKCYERFNERGIEMMETLDELKAIRDNAPDGATHIAQSKCSCRYLKHNVRRDFVYHDGRTFCAFPSKSGFLKTCQSIRLISDIKHLVELTEYSMSLESKLGIE